MIIPFRSAGRSAVSSFNNSASIAAMATAFMFAASPAAAQQTVPGVSGNCPIVAGVADCSGDLSGGITTGPGEPGFGTLNINPTGPIAPNGYFAIGVIKDDQDITINIADGTVIDVFDDPNIGGFAQALIAVIGNGFDLNINTGANITADGRDSFGLGIEAVVQGGAGNLDITNRGNITAFADGDSAIALQGRSENSTGNILIANSGTLSAMSGGTGERDRITAGIFGFHQLGGNLTVNNSGAISVSPGADTLDAVPNGFASAIVTTAFGNASATAITNSGTLTATGPYTNGITGVTTNNGSAASTMVIDNDGALNIDSLFGYGIFAQSSGTAVNMNIDNSAAIDITSTGAITGIFSLNGAQNAASSLVNTGDITGSGFNLRGLGISSFGAPAGGTYNYTVTNSGDMTFDAMAATGISVFATAEDNVTANVTNSGNFNFASSVGALSRGISATFDFVDASAGGADGNSDLTLFNSGNIILGAGIGIFTAADMIDITNEGMITINADNFDGIVMHGENVRLNNSGDIIINGENGVAIFNEILTDKGSNFNLTNSGDITLGGSVGGGIGSISIDAGASAVNIVAGINSGNITGAADGTGIAVLALNSQTAAAALTNSGNINFANSTQLDSAGININLEADSGNPDNSELSQIAVSSDGDITMGVGNAIVLKADTVVASVEGNVSTTGDSSTVLMFEASNSLSVDVDGTVTASGQDSNGVVIGSGGNGQSGTVSMSNSGVISATGAGATGVLSASGFDTLDNSGTITGAVNAIAIVQGSGGSLGAAASNEGLRNSGRIESLAVGGVAIRGTKQPPLRMLCVTWLLVRLSAILR
ncbi:beta strand repeat-containing protein [Parasphingorhabdus halotolerans]|uniref:Autotransporter domain-containing protein n=1 Tax=Parasphingorhabdus halotolerans TaxID=2725558 RepID=A0A6H2DKN4_9SPHN|nr:hypothetical protein [Parasphingorhabdus halotolerans]QJB68950.1 hypothetical protein HF685_06395 [Parasphingorhabdus halotolerans]